MADQTTDLILPSKAWLVLRVAWLCYLFGSGANLVVFTGMHAFFLEAAADEFSMVDPMAYASRLDQVLLVTSAVTLISYLVSVVGYGFFYHRSMLTAQALEPEHATVSATGMWWWYAVPFANLWKPVEGVMQVWRSVRRKADLPDSVPWVVALWWVTWLLGNGISKITDRLHPGSPVSRFPSNELADMAQYYIWSVPVILIVIVCCIALWWITDRIYQAQKIIVAGQADPVAGEGEPQALTTETPETA
ncbi:DUF4328 domain-containing protein [Oceanicaulis sp. LC35]|uniref:DUF4328 domain-containing protein n=1 Tax=Oceanicaulis sp. LC35 TaxID=3349635 RepID=UPI003F865186